MISIPETIELLDIGLPADYGQTVIQNNPEYFNVDESAGMSLAYQLGLRLTQLAYLVDNDDTMPLNKRNKLVEHIREKSRKQYALWAKEIAERER